MALRSLFAPRGIAVIGASTSPGKLGAAMAGSLASFPGPVVLVNDRRPGPASGFYCSVADAVEATGAAVDLAVLCVPAAATAGALREAAGAGVKAALVCAGGFAEAGGPGVGYQADVAAVVADTGLRLLGPNTSGFLAPGSSLVASFVPGAAGIPPGRISVVAGSGGILHSVSFLLAGAGLGLYLGVGIGNGLDVTAADVLDYLAQGSAPADENVVARTRTPSGFVQQRPDESHDGGSRPAPGPIALHLEGVDNGRRLVEAVARLTPHVPVVALVVGRNDVGDLARSHTGALTPPWRTARAVLRAAGAVLVDDERELVDALVALDTGRLPAGGDPGVGLVTGQAGPAVLFTDRLKTAGVSLPPLGRATTDRLAELLPALTHQGNPVDTGRPGGTFAEIVALVGADPAIDLLAVYALLEPGAFDLTAAVRTVTGGPRPIVVATGGPPTDVATARRALAAAGVAAYDGVAGAVTGVRALVDDARARAARGGGDEPVRLLLPEPIPVPIGEHEGKLLLVWLGIATPSRVSCVDRADAHAALRHLGGPVVVKMLEPVVPHKARVGGVRLGVRTGDDLEAALDALDAAGARRYLVEETVPPGLDLIVAARRDPLFGPMVVLGLGGDVAEALDTVVVHPAPLSEPAATGVIGELLGPVPPERVDRLGLAAVLTSLGALLAAVPEFDEIEINPLRVTADGRLVALDVVIDGPGGAGTLDEVVTPADVAVPGDAVAVGGATAHPSAAAVPDGQGGL